jgi:secreted trypsin-like serine protease
MSETPRTELQHQQHHEETSTKQHQRDRQLVIHGEWADYTRFPYFALVGDYCGGSLIAPDIVLTAGHCKQYHRHYPHEIRIGPKSRHVHYSDHREDDDDDERTSIRHKSIHQVRHPDYECRGDDEFTNDILIIQLAEPSDRPYVRLDNEVIHNTPVMAMGMGWTNKYKPSTSNHLQTVLLDTIDNDVCSQVTARNMTYDGRIDDSMMCTTGGDNNERDTWYVVHAAVGLFCRSNCTIQKTQNAFFVIAIMTVAVQS